MRKILNDIVLQPMKGNPDPEDGELPRIQILGPSDSKKHTGRYHSDIVIAFETGEDTFIYGLNDFFEFMSDGIQEHVHEQAERIKELQTTIHTLTSDNNI